MGLFYTKKGDKGRSHIGKKTVSKILLEVEALGQLDELNSMIGVLKSLPTGRAGQKISRDLQKILHQIQENLFIIQANIANVMMGNEFKAPYFGADKTEKAEKIIDKIEAELKPVRGFIISGTNNTSAWLDFMRAKSRNVERAVLKINKINSFPEIKSYLNRLSSLLFALARWEARGKKEKNPKYK